MAVGLLASLFLCGPARDARAGAVERPEAAAWLLEADGKVLSRGNQNKRLPQASLTKIMTALVALEKANPEEVVTVSREAASETGTRLGLKKGDRIKVVELVAGALIASGNDAARALAEHVGGTEEKFVAMMNARAEELKLGDTHFANASGHDDPANYSSASDLALLTKVAMKIPAFAGIVGSTALSIKTVDGRIFKVENKNELMGRYPGAIGVKSGTTPGAGKSLVALAARDGHWALLVLLGAKERWYTSVRMLDQAFAEIGAGAK